MTREDFLARAANLYDTGHADEELFALLVRWLDIVARFEGGQIDIFLQLMDQERDRLRPMGGHNTLANDALGSRLTEFAAILSHPCARCATDPHAWWTRPGFCSHRGKS